MTDLPGGFSVGMAFRFSVKARISFDLGSFREKPDLKTENLNSRFD